MGLFRTLRADEIDVRIGQAGQGYLKLLLYKDARADMNLLDEAVGPYGWCRTHQLIGDRLYCTVSILTENGWVAKQDVGVESQTEAEKGQASDSFKRACTNWGIGRELYTGPEIMLWQSKNTFTVDPKKGKCYDKFHVGQIEYDDGVITKLTIVNEKLNRVVFSYGVTAEDAEKLAQNGSADSELGKSTQENHSDDYDPNAPITEAQQETIKELCDERGLDPESVFEGIWPDLTQEQYGVAVQKLKRIKKRGNKRSA